MELSPPIQIRYHSLINYSSALPKAVRAKERGLQATKWFDYRFISPGKATEIFRDEFIGVYRSFYGAHVETSEAKNKSGCRTGLWKRKDFLVFTRARQFADSLSVPYRHFLWTVFEYFHEKGWQRLPNVNQLYGKREETLAKLVVDRWQEKCSEFPMFSRVAPYKNEHYRELPDQQAHRRWVVEQLHATGRSPHAIARVCFDYGVLPEEIAVAEFGNDLVDQARNLPPRIDPDAGPHATGPFLPTCIGVGEPDPLVSPCSECQLTSACLILGRKVHQSLVAKYTVDDPVTKKKQHDIKVRVQKHRAKKKALSALTTQSTTIQ